MLHIKIPRVFFFHTDPFFRALLCHIPIIIFTDLHTRLRLSQTDARSLTLSLACAQEKRKRPHALSRSFSPRTGARARSHACSLLHSFFLRRKRMCIANHFCHPPRLVLIHQRAIYMCDVNRSYTTHDSFISPRTSSSSIENACALKITCVTLRTCSSFVRGPSHKLDQPSSTFCVSFFFF